MGKPTLLVVSSTFPRWQNDTDPPFVYELSKRLLADFEVHLLAPHYPGAQSAETMDGIRVHRFRYFFSPLEKLAGDSGILPTLRRNRAFYLLVPFFFIGQFLALLRLTRQVKPDVIHAHWLIPQGVSAALVKKITGVPFLVTAHGGDIFALQNLAARMMKKMVLTHAAAITVVSRAIGWAVEQVLHGVSAKTKVLPMGVDSLHFSPEQADPNLRSRFTITGPLLLFVGRLTEKKGVRYLLEAMPAVVMECPDVKLLIVGSGEAEPSLKALSGDLHLDGRVIFTGPVPNSSLPSYYASSDIFIGPSIQAAGGDTEGFGLTFVEAGMAGCMVIGTRVGGIGDIIEDGETGFLVDEKNPAAIATAILAVLGRKKDWPAFRAKTRKVLIDKFDWQTIAAGYSEVLRSAIPPSRP